MVAVARGARRFLLSKAIGAVVTELDARRTLSGLAAAGDCACTGVPGANRPAPDGAFAGHLVVRRGARPVLERWN